MADTQRQPTAMQLLQATENDVRPSVVITQDDGTMLRSAVAVEWTVGVVFWTLGVFLLAGLAGVEIDHSVP